MNKQFCTFFLDDHLFGVDVLAVQEVNRFQEMTRVPLASRIISGLMNLRGQIVTALDLRQILGLAPAPEGTMPCNVVIHTDEGAMSLVVDEVGDVIETDDAVFESTPDTVKGVSHELLLGVYKLDKRLLIVLDTDKVIHFEV